MAESRGWWDHGVKVRLRGVSTATVVSNSQQAAEVLLYRWPKQPGPKHLEARWAVLKAMESALDRQRQADARKAFAEAASEAGISLE